MEPDDDLGEAIVEGSRRIASAITANAVPGRDEAGGYVGSLTEAIMGVTAGLVAIAKAIEELAEAMRERDETD